jgi:uncharacterized protein YndB with AHSA1/START domain
VKLRNATDNETKVERETELPAGPDEVWESLTEEDRLEQWLGTEVELDPVEGGEIRVRDDDGERTGTVETVIERERLGFTWAAPGEDPSSVEFAIEAIPGGSRLTVTETLAGPLALSAVWAPRLRALHRVLALAFA